MGTQGAGRKRTTNKERSTAEDDALNLIAREAEARLAAKRAARAEAREIRMKELERQQKEIFQVQKKYYGLNTKLDDRQDSKWGDIEQWMEDSERYSRPSQMTTLSDDDERMSVGSRGSVRSDLDARYAGGGSSTQSHKKSKKKKKHKHKDRDRNGCDDQFSLLSSRGSVSSRLSDDSRVSRGSRLDLQPASYTSSDLYSLNGPSSSRNASSFDSYQFYRSLSHISQQLYRRSAVYDDSHFAGSRRGAGSTSHPLDFSSYRNSSSRTSSRASSARTSPVDNCSSVASYLRSAAGSGGGLPRDLDDVTIPDFSDVEDRDYLEKGSRAASALTAATLTSLGGTSSRRGSGETSITVDAETSIREIKDALVEVEEKYRKAMVSNAQLDNEKNNLMYQVDTLKDSLMELEELLSESRREYEEKVKEYEREKHAHGVLQFQFTEMKETLKQSEELLNKHGIVLGPDLNINGDASGTQTDGDSGPPAAQETQAPPTDGNSMLGSTEELRRSREEEADPRERHPDTLQEGTGDLSSNQLGNVADVDAVEREMCSNRQDVGDEDSQAEVNELPAVDEMVCGPQVEGSENSPEENVAGTSSSGGRVSGGDVLEMANSPAVEQENEEARKRESRPSVAEVAKEEFISEAHQEPENAEEISSKVQPGGSAPGKKKKKKRRGKKKGVPHEERKQQRDVKEEDGSDQENSKSEKENESVSAAERDIDGHVTVNKSKMDEVNEQQGTEETNAVEPAESQAESLEEPRVEPLPDEQNDKLHSEDSDLPAAIVTHDQVPEEDPEPNNNAATESGSPGHNGTCDNSELIPEQTLEPENMEEVMSCAAEADRTEGVRSLEDGSSIDPLRPAGQVCLSGTFEEGGAESHVQSHVDAAVEPVNSSESETKASLEPTDDITDGLKSPSGSELLSDLPAAIDAHIQVPEAVPETDNDAATDSGSPGTDNGTSDNSELKRHLSEEEELSEVAPVKQENSMTATQASDLDEAGIQMCLVDKSNTEASSETELIDPDGPEEPGTKQDHQDEGSFTQDDPEHGSGQNDSGRKDSCLPPQQDSEEEDGDEEGQSFDFDDMDVEAAIEINDPEQEDLEEGVEVVADKSDDGRSRETEPVGDEDQRRSGDDVEEDDSASQNKLKSQEDTTSETRQTQGTEQGNVPDAKDENVEEAAVEEEGLDAVKQELQGGEDVVLPKSPSQVGRNKESALSGKDVKKNGKKGKSKGKEECKMS